MDTLDKQPKAPEAATMLLRVQVCLPAGARTFFVAAAQGAHPQAPNQRRQLTRCCGCAANIPLVVFGCISCKAAKTAKTDARAAPRSDPRGETAARAVGIAPSKGGEGMIKIELESLFLRMLRANTRF